MKFFLKLFFKTCCRIEYIDQQNVPPTGGFVLSSNHMSYYDPFAVGTGVCQETHWMAKEELFMGIAGLFIKGMKSFPVKRDQLDRGAISHSLKVIKSGQVVGIFPEGTRSEDGEIKEGHLGAALIAMNAGVPVVPAALVGTKNALVRKFPPRWQKVLVKYGRPVHPDDFKGGRRERMENMTTEIMDSIRKLKKELEEKWEP
jgi:1-acyl-sn-glycerol-3-phosphate acyltransferase